MGYEKGTLVNLASWATYYIKGANNHSDVYWLWPGKHVKMTYVDSRMTWSYEDGVDEPDMDKVAAALLFYEARGIKTVLVKLKPVNGKLPDPDDIKVCCKHSHSVWEDTRRWRFDSKPQYFTRIGEAVYDMDGAMNLMFSSPVDYMAKIYLVCESPLEIDPVMEVYENAVWKDTVQFDIEWEDDYPSKGELRIHNGELFTAEAVNGVIMDGGFSWTGEAGKKHIRAKAAYTEAEQHSKTIVTIWTDTIKTSFYLEELINNPIWIPRINVYISQTGGMCKNSFIDSLNGQSLKTIRQRVNELPEADIETSVRVHYGDVPLRMFAVPPYEPKAELNVPDPIIMGQWRNAAFHLKRWCWQMPDGTYCVSIWPFDKGAPARRDGNEGVAAIAGESERNIRVLDWLGLHDVAQGGIDYWLIGERGRPYFKFAEAFGNDALANPYNGFNKTSPGYDEKHAPGHGHVLKLFAHHYRITKDKEWLHKHKDRVVGACRAIGRLRAELKKRIGPDSWCHGLLPPSSSGDLGETRIHYHINYFFWSGLWEAGKILKEENYPEADEILAEADDFKNAILSALEKTIAYCPVVKVKDGSYRRYVTWQPYARGKSQAMDMSADPNYFECVINGAMFIPDLIGPNDPIADEQLDMLEDTLYIHSNDIPGGSPFGDTKYVTERKRLRVDPLSKEEEAILYKSGYGVQPALELFRKAYLCLGEAPSYIRAVYNAFGSTIDPGRGWVFWEGPNEAGAIDKTFEEAGFIECIRWMMIAELGGDLWLARMIPKKWLENGCTVSIKNAPTYFGDMGFSIYSNIDGGLITAVIDMPTRDIPKTVALRLRHPKGEPIKSVLLNGAEYKNFDNETVYIKGFTNKVEVKVNY